MVRKPEAPRQHPPRPGSIVVSSRSDEFAVPFPPEVLEKSSEGAHLGRQWRLVVDAELHIKKAFDDLDSARDHLTHRQAEISIVKCQIEELMHQVCQRWTLCDGSGSTQDSAMTQKADTQLQTYVVGQLVERRDGSGDWDRGYITSVSPLRVTVSRDPHATGFQWDEVRPMPQAFYVEPSETSAVEKLKLVRDDVVDFTGDAQSPIHKLDREDRRLLITEDATVTDIRDFEDDSSADSQPCEDKSHESRSAHGAGARNQSPDSRYTDFQDVDSVDSAGVGRSSLSKDSAAMCAQRLRNIADHPPDLCTSDSLLTQILPYDHSGFREDQVADGSRVIHDKGQDGLLWVTSDIASTTEESRKCVQSGSDDRVMSFDPDASSSDGCFEEEMDAHNDESKLHDVALESFAEDELEGYDFEEEEVAVPRMSLTSKYSKFSADMQHTNDMQLNITLPSTVPSTSSLRDDTLETGTWAIDDVLTDKRRLPLPKEEFRDLLIGSGCWIQKTEERAITLRQLEALLAHLRKRCIAENWTDSRSRLLMPSAVNLYDAVRYVVTPATEPRKCSYVEFVADSSQRPTWFVSHWWGEPVCDFVSCLGQHSNDRCLGKDASYWVCAYANNQWHVDDELGHDPTTSSFRRAMNLAEGTISVLDREAVCFSRIWCCYEIWVSLMDERVDDHSAHLYDIYTTTAHGSVGIAEGFTASDKKRDRAWWKDDKYEREKEFPLTMAREAMAVELQAARASRDNDRRAILNIIANSNDLNAEPPKTNFGYTELNHMLRGRFAAATWRKALEMGLDMFTYCSALQSSLLRRLDLSFDKCSCLIEESLSRLVGSLPSTLEVLALDFSGCPRVRNEGLAEFANKLRELRDLTTLQLALNGNYNVDDEGIAAFAEHFPRALTSLELDLSATQVSDVGVTSLATHFPNKLTHLRLDLRYAPITDQGVVALTKQLPLELTSLDIDFGSTEIGDAAAIALVDDAPPGLSSLLLDLPCTQVTDEGATAILDRLFHWEQDMQNVHVNLENTLVTQSIQATLQETIQAVHEQSMRSLSSVGYKSNASIPSM